LFIQVVSLLSNVFFPFIFPFTHVFPMFLRLKKLYLHHSRIDYGCLKKNVVVTRMQQKR
jgi:hypothetical protein